MRAFWKKGSVVSLRIKADLFTLGQMVDKGAKMRFFSIFRTSDKWDGLDLNNVETLFCVAIGNVVLQRLGVRRIPSKEVVPSQAPFERYFIDVGDNSEGYRLRGEYMWRGGRLVDLGAEGQHDAWNAPTIIQNLTVELHRDIILKHEFCNMYGDNHVKDRLLKFVESGLNEDPLKAKVFPELLKTE